MGYKTKNVHIFQYYRIKYGWGMIKNKKRMKIAFHPFFIFSADLLTDQNSLSDGFKHKNSRGDRDIK